MSTYHVIKADGTQVGDAHARRRGAVGAAVLAIATGTVGNDELLRVVKRKEGFTEALRATVVRSGTNGVWDIQLDAQEAQPVAAAEPEAPAAEAAPAPLPPDSEVE